MRSDIADIRLADQVFAPHYASPMAMRVTAETALRAGSAADADIVARLNPGDLFEGLEFAGGNVWGIAPGCGQVGYVDAAMLTAVAP